MMAMVGDLGAPLLYKRFFNILSGDYIVESKVSSLIVVLIWIAIVGLFMQLGYRIAQWAALRYVSRVVEDLANTCFQYLHQHSYDFFINNFTGSLVKKINRFAKSFNHIFDRVFWDLIGLATRVVIASVILFTVNKAMGIILLVWMIIFLSISYLVVLYRLKYDIPRAEVDSEATGVLADTITNAMNVKLFNSHKREYKIFGDVNRKGRMLKEKAWMVDWKLNIAQGLLLLFVEMGLMYYAVLLWQKGLLTLGDFVLIQSYLIIIIHQVWAFTWVVRDLYEALADAEEMTEIFNTPIEVRDVHGAKVLKVTKGEIVFQDVDFSYNQTRKVLSRFNLSIKPGEKVALVGPSGAGKSTIIKLLFRYFDVEKGKIFVDNQRTSQVTQDSLLANVSLVPQDPILFHRTLMDNIRYGNAKATNEDVLKAAQLAHCHDFIKDYPDQYSTYVGERGVKLSGGERQRVAIARAIIKNAPILILDEATSSLDSQSEKLIQTALKKLMKGKTTIVIAHRLSTIMEMDRIVVMDKGRIVEEGTHDELLNNKNGLYKKLWEVQVGGFIKN